MTFDLASYFLGLFTLPVGWVALATIAAMFLPNKKSTRCGVCGFETAPYADDEPGGKSVPFARWAKWQYHRLFLRPRPVHREGLRAWRIERGFDPDTGKRA